MTETLSPYAELAISTVAPSPTNPRKTFLDLEDLAASIREQGVMQPILARLWPEDYPTPEGRAERPLYEIVAGERRYRASLLAGLDTIPALVRVLTTRQVLEAQIVENLQRRDVTELEEAEGYQLMMRDHGYTADQLAEKVGKSRAYIYGRLKLCELCEEARQLYREGKLDASRALLVARIPVPELQVRAAAEIINGYGGTPMSARQAAAHIQQGYMLDLTKAPFKAGGHYVITVKGLAGENPLGLIKCTECPNRTGNDPETYPGINPDACTDPTCYADKRAAHLAKEAEIARDSGHKVIIGEAAKKIAPHGIYSHEAGDYVVLDEKSYYGGELQTARKAIKGQDVQIVMIEDHRKGTLVPMVAKKELNEALKAKGIKVSNSSRDPRDIEREKARKVEKQYRVALFEQHHAAARSAINCAAKPALGREDLALVARQFLVCRGSNTSKYLARLYVPDAPERGPKDSQWQDDDYRRYRRMIEMLSELNAAQLMLFLLDLALVGTLDVPTYTDDISTPLPLLAAVERAGLDAEAIRPPLDAKPAAKAILTPQQAAPAAEVVAPKFEVGQSVRVKDGACWENGQPIGEGNTPGTIQCAVSDGYAVLFTDGHKRTYLPAYALESEPLDQVLEPVSTAGQAAPAPADTTPKPARAKKAAPAAAKSPAKPKKQAATAAKKSTGKAKSSGRARPAERKKKTTAAPADDAPVEHDDKTIDLIDAHFPELAGAGQAQQEAAV